MAELPAHSHRLWAITGTGSFGEVQGFQGSNGIAADGSGSAYRSTNGNSIQLVENTGTGAAHSHNADAVPDHTHTVTNVRPPFVALFFIMKV